LNNEFYHKTINSADVESYFSKQSGKDLSKIFDQYLRTIKIPVLEYKLKGDNLSYRWTHTVDDFDMPVRLTDGTWLRPTGEWENTAVGREIMNNGPVPDKNFYITVKKSE
jgi:aminopeptidase N